MSLLPYLTLLFALASASQAVLATPAFPGAEGDGANSRGGRAGRVLVVDRLDDPCPTQACTTEDLNNVDQLIPGTLRWALMQPFPRTVVFRVSGVIELLPDRVRWDEKNHEIDIDRLANIRIKSPFLTVAGQTAPAGGITLKNNGITLLTHDVVLRYLRFRTGRQLPVFAGQQTPETLMIENNAKDIIIDHCSLSWMPAEGLSVYTGDSWDGSKASASDITLSWNIVGEGLVQNQDGRGHPNAAFMSGFNGDAKYAATRITLHHNLLVHSQKRNGDLLSQQGRLINNLVYNWQWLPTVLAGGGQTDVIANIWKPGPVTRAGYAAERGGLHLVPAAQDLNSKDPDGWWHALPGTPSLYVQGNLYGRTENTATPLAQLICYYRARTAPCQAALPAGWLRKSPLPVSAVAVSVQPAVDAEIQVLAKAGARQRIDARGRWVNNRDPVDERYVREYTGGTYSRETFPWHEEDVGGFPVMIEGQPYPDRDRDGMADAWEASHGLDPDNPDDGRQQVPDKSGYTYLEWFINGHASH